MAHGVNNKTGSSFLLVALAAILILGGVLAACKQAQTTTTTTKPTTTSAQSPTTTSAPTRTTTSAPTPTTVSAADFYKANVVTVVVPYGPGGTGDFVARLLANYWTEVTGGRMIVDNRAGGGGLTGDNYVYAAKPDGLTMGVEFPGGNLFGAVLAQDPALKLDMKKMIWIGFLNREDPALGVSVKAPYTSMDDISKAKGFKFASTGRASVASLGAAVAIDLFGLRDPRIVLGYSGSAEAFLAVGKGEVDGYAVSPSLILDGMNKGYVKQPVVNLSFRRSAYFPNVPAIPDLLKLSPEQENLLKTLSAFGGGQAFWFPPGVPQDRIDFVRGAFDKAMALDGLVKLAKTRFPIWITPVGGKDFSAQIGETLAVVTPERFAVLQRLADKYQ